MLKARLTGEHEPDQRLHGEAHTRARVLSRQDVLRQIQRFSAPARLKDGCILGNKKRLLITQGEHRTHRMRRTHRPHVSRAARNQRHAVRPVQQER